MPPTKVHFADEGSVWGVCGHGLHYEQTVDPEKVTCGLCRKKLARAVLRASGLRPATTSSWRPAETENDRLREALEFVVAELKGCRNVDESVIRPVVAAAERGLGR